MRQKSARLFLILAVFASFAAATVLLAPACTQNSAGGKIEPYKAEIKLTDQQMSFLLGAARKGLSGESVPEFPEDLKAVEGAGAVVEVFLPPNKPVIATVGGKPFATTFKAAVKEAASDSAFSKIKTDLAKARIKVGVIDEIFKFEIKDKMKSEALYKTIAKKTEDGVTGFALAGKNGKAAYQIPESVLYFGWAMEGEKRFMGHKLVAKQIKDLSQSVYGDSKKWVEGELYGFTLVTFIDDVAEHGKPVVTYRAKNLLPPLDAAALRAATMADADYLAAAVNDKGKFNYIYYPDKDEYEKGYSIVRHAGSAFGLFEAYNVFKDQKYLDAGRRAVDYLLERIENPKDVPQIALIMENGSSVLGTNALAAMALASIPEDKLTEKDKEYRQKLGESILYFRMPEKGLFYTSFEQAFKKNPPKKQAAYYPGESMLSLVRLYERTGDQKWLNAAKDIAPGQKTLWENDGHTQVGNYCWVGQAFARMARIEKDPKLRDEYKKIAYSHGDAVMKHQFGHPDNDKRKYSPDYVGGADNSKPPRTTPTSARGESLAEIYQTAKFLGDKEAQKKYGAALMEAIHFCIENQWSAQNSWFLPYPEKARGGIRGSLIANDIRIDYNQHLLTTMLNALSVPDDLKALNAQ